MNNLSTHLEQLETDGYTVIPNFIDPQTAARVRAHMDELLGPVLPRDGADAGRVHTLRHPIPGAIMAEILNNPDLIELAKQLLHPNDLRLLEQVLIRSDPRPARPEDAGPTRATGWHLDMAFLPEHYQSRPRQTYFHMVHSLSDVPAGGGGTTFVPGSHLKTYAVAQELGSIEALAALKKDPVGVAGIDLGEAVEMHPQLGDLLVFNPMCLHSASKNISDSPRYVYFASFYDASAAYLESQVRKPDYHKAFPDSLRENLPAELQSLLS